MSGPVCAKCGQCGASYCSVVSESGEPVGDWFHPICFAPQGVQENVDFQRVRRRSCGQLPALQERALRQVRPAVGKSLQPVQREVRGLSPQARGVQGSGKRQCL